MLTPTQVIKSFVDTVEKKTIPAGEIIFAEGEIAELMYGLVEGEVEVIVNDKVIEVIQPGDVFGVGAIVRPDNKRESTTRAKTDCKIFTLDKITFLFLVQETPMFAIELMRSYSDRLVKLKHSV
ncbi:MAG: cyclic nucleotide-binding domain-containing protein [Gloeocapsa sp. DLM2.Bin57]|nr:MAG: cyclic nucleotide-binding domain-containing protein [Gloeocapsa sp. DLM2.Bin57]